ncbi:MAG: hypothetical protein IPL53_13155 [Ignavibacteria bacterium]|nr:hypothetical protein [Ignavibacteria bacterium]
MNQYRSIRQGIIAVADITFYTIVNGTLKVLGKTDTENELEPEVLQTIKKMYPDSEITAAESVSEKGKLVFKVESGKGKVNNNTRFSKDDGEFIDINSVD